MENQKQLEERLEKMGYKLRIKDNTIEDYFVIDTKINGKRYYHKRRYNKDNKQEAFEQLSKIQNNLIKEFSVDWKCIDYFPDQCRLLCKKTKDHGRFFTKCPVYALF